MRLARVLMVATSVASMFPVLAAAGPAGTYTVVGRDPSTSAEYRGTLTIAENRGYFDVTWTIAGYVQTGIALGSGDGPDGPTHLSVAYSSGTGYGIAEYSLQPDGAWKGTWLFKGGAAVSTEEWLVGDGSAARDLSKSPKPAKRQNASP